MCYIHSLFISKFKDIINFHNINIIHFICVVRRGKNIRRELHVHKKLNNFF